MMNNSRPTRVLMTADTVGGVWTYAMELSKALGEMEVEVALATMGAPLSNEQRAEAQSLPNLEVFESDFKLEWMADPWKDVARAGEWLLKLEQQLRPDFVHLNSFAHGSLPWRAPVLMVAHSCVLSWWRAVKGEPAPAEWDRYTQEVRRGLRAAHVVAAPSDFMLTALEKHYGLLPVRVLIPNGRDPARFPSGVKEAFVLTAGRLWDEAKNLRALDSVASCLAWPVYAAGGQMGPAAAPAEFRNVRTLGMQSSGSLAHWMGRASIYALPARYEPFGLSVLEAALAGCALVLGDIPSLREVWGDTAVFVPPDDTEALEGALSLLIEDESLRKMFAGLAQSRALTFSPQRMAQKYITAYSLASCIKESRSGRPAWEGRRAS
jgi:glycogen(starch) synthase